MYKLVKKSAGSQSYPSHPKWEIVAQNGARIGIVHNMVYADKIVRFLNADAEKYGFNNRSGGVS